MVGKKRSLRCISAFMFSYLVSITVCYGNKWSLKDVGSDQSLTQVKVEDEHTLKIESSGLNIGDNKDQFSFRYIKHLFNGDESVGVRSQILSVEPGASESNDMKAGVMMRNYLREPSRNVFLGVTESGQIVLQHRKKHSAETTVDKYPNPSKFPVWLKLEQIDEMCYAFTSQDGRTWTELDRIDFLRGQRVCLGLAVANGTATFHRTSTVEETLQQEAMQITEIPVTAQKKEVAKPVPGENVIASVIEELPNKINPQNNEEKISVTKPAEMKKPDDISHMQSSNTVVKLLYTGIFLVVIGIGIIFYALVKLFALRAPVKA